jgi:hypothetical protein
VRLTPHGSPTPAKSVASGKFKNNIYMKIKVTFFSNQDEILGAVVNALAAQVAGSQIVGRMNRIFLKNNGFYRFNFATSLRAARFTSLIESYVPAHMQSRLTIMDDSN